MEVLLPHTRSEFASETYWDAFFKERDAHKAFEWYGSYSDIRPVLRSTLRKLRSVRGRELQLLVPGCGNSELSVRLHRDGFLDVTNIDFNATVIEGMAAKYPEMMWVVADACDLRPIFPKPSNFDAVLDKGTLDAIVSDESAESHKRGTAVLSEVDRLLKSDGIYAVITLAQSFVVNCLFDALLVGNDGYGGSGSWTNVQVFSIPSTETPSPLLAFLIMATKREMNDGMSFSSFYYEAGDIVLHFDKEGRAFDDGDNETHLKRSDRSQLLSFLRQAQLAHRHRYELSRLRPGRLLEEWLWMKRNLDSPHYSLLVLDVSVPPSEQEQQQLRLCTVLLVPRGRESEYTFNTFEGLSEIAQHTGAMRLVAVRLCPGHTYPSQEAVKTELSGSLRQFSPRLAENGTPFPPGIVHDATIPILAVVNDMGSDVEVLTRGTLNESGGYIVEEGREISNGDRTAKDAAVLSWKKRRRLVFDQNPGVIQSEVRLVGYSKGAVEMSSSATKPKIASTQNNKSKKNKKKIRSRNLNPTPPVEWCFDYLRPCFDYHRSMLAGSSLALLNPVHTAGKGGGGLVLGLGGGGLPMAIRALMPHIPVAVCEIEEGLIEVAEKWFGFQQGPMLQAVPAEALAFTKACANVNSSPESTTEVLPNLLLAPPFTPPYSAIFMDVDSKDLAVGMSCPPLEFVSPSSLSTFHALLWKKGGVLLINIAARKASMRSAAVDATIAVFGSEFVRTLSVGEDETNSVIVAWKGLESSTAPFHTQYIEKKLMSTAIQAGMTTEEAQDLSGILQRLQ